MSEPTTSPDEAFSALCDGTRPSILQALGEAHDPLSFSDLRERAGSPESSRFNYYLGKLTDHFVAKRDDGYELRRAGAHTIDVDGDGLGITVDDDDLLVLDVERV